MIEAYMKATEDVLRLAGQMFLRRMDDQLRWFAEDLHDFIYELDRNPRRDWRERFDAFLADQTARGRELTPESRKQLIIYLDPFPSARTPHRVRGRRAARHPW